MNLTIHKNPNPEEYAEIAEAVKINEGYCPCLSVKNEDTKCMCKDFRESEEVGFCHCGRYYKTKEYETIAIVADVSNYSLQEDYLDWYKMLIYQDFEVIGIPIDIADYQVGMVKCRNLYKSLIAKANAILVLNHSKEIDGLIEEFIYWAEELGKKVLTAEDLGR